MTGCNFNQALVRAALTLQDERLPARWSVGIVRDVYGRLRGTHKCLIEVAPSHHSTPPAVASSSKASISRADHSQACSDAASGIADSRQ